MRKKRSPVEHQETSNRAPKIQDGLYRRLRKDQKGGKKKFSEGYL